VHIAGSSSVVSHSTSYLAPTAPEMVQSPSLAQ
jgi:hypothetical protein